MVHYKQQQNSGFALLISLIVVTVVITIGLAILDLTLKQLRLSTNSKDSEIAFHAANAGLECARYWRERASSTIESATPAVFPLSCFGGSPNSIIPVPIDSNGGGTARSYKFESTWGEDGSQRCSDMTIVSVNSDFSATTTVTNAAIASIVPGYPRTTDSYKCPPGGRCTIIASRGYSKACDSISNPGTIEREVLLEL